MSRQLFLLEVLVHDVVAEAGAKRPLAVRAKFLALPGFSVPAGGGTSCVFSMRPCDVTRELPARPLAVSVCCAEGRELGRAILDLARGLQPCPSSSSAAGGDDRASCAAMHGTFPLVRPAGQGPAGSVSLQVRLSCYGRAVISKCRVGGKDQVRVEPKE